MRLTERERGFMSINYETALQLQLQGYRLTTAEIVYHLPDYPDLLQMYIWQEYDLSPDFPILHKFLDFWENNIDGKLHAVQVVSTDIIKPGEVHHINAFYTLH